MIEVSQLSVGYKGAAVLSDISVTLRPGSVLTVVGSNGAGKSTLLRTISGLLQPWQGRITLGEKLINGLSPADIVDLGIAHVPEGRKIFPGLTVRENLMLGAYRLSDKALVAQNYDKVFGMFPILCERAAQVGTTLSGGEQQMLAIGRALMSSPKVLLLDEPTMGLAPLVIENLLKTLLALKKVGISILLVEQNAAFALKLADDVALMQLGRLRTSGTKAEIERDESVLNAYLGVD